MIVSTNTVQLMRHTSRSMRWHLILFVRVAGARTYYLNRSQPPLMSAMIKIVYAATQNRTLLTTALPVRLPACTVYVIMQLVHGDNGAAMVAYALHVPLHAVQNQQHVAIVPHGS
jgi:Trehalase